MSKPTPIYDEEFMPGDWQDEKTDQPFDMQAFEDSEE
jgi:hypothetical protein